MANDIKTFRTKKKIWKFIPWGKKKTNIDIPRFPKLGYSPNRLITTFGHYYYCLALMFVSAFCAVRGMHSVHAVQEVGSLSERSIRNVWRFSSFPGTCRRASMIKISQSRGRKNEDQVSSAQIQSHSMSKQNFSYLPQASKEIVAHVIFFTLFNAKKDVMW